jgi:hypothetical protein
VNIVPRRNTPITAAVAVTAVRNAYFDFFDEDAPRKVLELLLALVWVETGRGKSCQNFNVGNITASNAFSGDAWRPTWFDLDDGGKKTERDVFLHNEMLAGRAPFAFRAYPSLQAGCADFIRILDRSFSNVLEAAEDGDPEEFREALAEKYSKDYDNPRHTETFRLLQQEFRGILDGTPGIPDDRGFPFLKVFGVVAIAAAAGGVIWLSLRKPEPQGKGARAAA